MCSVSSAYSTPPKMFDEAVIDMGSGNLVRVPELSARLAVGEKGPVGAASASNHALLTSVTGRPSSTHVWSTRSLRVPTGQCTSE